MVEIAKRGLNIRTAYDAKVVFESVDFVPPNMSILPYQIIKDHIYL